MGKLIRMDLYRMVRARAFQICLILTAVIALSGTPLNKLMFTLAKTLAPDVDEAFAAEAMLSEMIKNPFPLFGLLLTYISLCYFFYADVENGYIKNIAGQMPMKGFTILSKFIAAFVHNVLFALAAIVGNLIGTLFVQRIVADGAVLDGLRVLVLKLLLIQSISAILLLAVATFRSKSLGMILAVLFGLGMTSLIYMGIGEGLGRLFGQTVDVAAYMPDTVMGEEPLDTVKALLVAVVTGAVFLLPAIRIFDRKDVK